MLTPLILFLGLTVATAVIAYWSDNLGKKLGKKRVSLFGLRPRTTATVLTISSSWAIMLFTLAVLLIAVAPLRNALFRYDAERAEYNRDRARFLRENASAQTLLAMRQQKLSTTQKSLDTATSQLDANAAQLRKANVQLRGANVELRGANAAIKTARSQAKSAAAEAKAAQNQAQEAQNRSREAVQREAEARRGERQAEKLRSTALQQLRASRTSLDQVVKRFDAVQSRLATANSQLTTVQAQLKTAGARLKTARKTLNQAGEAFRSVARQYLTISRQSLALQQQRTELQRQRDELQKQVSDLASATQFYSEAALQLAGGDVKIPVGRAFAARIINAGQSPTIVEAMLRTLFTQGQIGFEKSEDTAAQFANGARLQLLPLPVRTGDNVAFLEGDQIYESKAREVAAQGETTSLRLVAARNFTAEEKNIMVRFVAVPVAVAFRDQETLASALIDGSLGDARIFNNLLNLIEDGRKEAVKRKVDPPQSPDEPNFFASGTNVSLFEALRRIEAGKRVMRVNLVAAQDLSTVEPLRVRFEIESSPNDS